MRHNRKEQRALTVRDDRMLLLHHFWSIVLPVVGAQVPRWAGHTPSESSWISASSGVPGIRYDLWVRQNDVGSQVYFDAGAGKYAWSKAVFDALHDKRSVIEAAYGGPLNWHRCDNRQASSFDSIAARSGYKSGREGWPDLANKVLQDFKRFEAAVQPHLQSAADAAGAK